MMRSLSLAARRDADGVFTFPAPDRPAGQRSVLGLRTEPIECLRVGFVGLGLRGPTAVERFTHIEGVRIAALCDVDPERVEAAQRILADRNLPAAAAYTGAEGWRRLCERDDVDLVYVCTPWDSHTPIALYAMEQGRHVAVEVPAATSLAECWALVDTAERTQRHCMMLENCIYDLFALTTLRMAQEGVLGDLLHVEGAYIHPFDTWERWRLEFNRRRRGDLYATHGLGPACQLLDIHRGDRLDYLVAVDTPAVGGSAAAGRQTGDPSFANGDQTSTLLRTVRGRTVSLQHNVATPRPYSRRYQVVGSEGFAEKYPAEEYAFSARRIAELFPDGAECRPNEYLPEPLRRPLAERFRHPIAAQVGEERARRIDPVREGINFRMDYRLVYCLRHGLPLDQDVYDAAEWSSMGELTALSLAHRSAPVAVPDFTRGEWERIDGYRHAYAE